MRRATFSEFVILSLLLHLLGILLFGSTSGTGTVGGKAYWGTLAVTLPFPLAAPGIGLKLDRGGQLSLPGSRPAETRPVETRPVETKPVEQAISPAITPTLERKPNEIPLAPAQTLERIPAPEVKPPIAVPVEVKPSEVPLVPVQTMERIAPQRVELPIAPPVELKASEVPLVPTQTLERIAPPSVVREMAAPVEARQSDVPLVPTEALERIAPQQVAPQVAAPVELKASEVPLVPTQTLERIAPAQVNREIASQPAEMAPAPAPAQIAPRPVQREVITAPMPSGRGSRTAPPDVVDDPFSRPPSSGTAREGPALDLDAMRARARDITKEGVGQRAVLPFPMPAGAARKSKEQLAIEQAWKPDCKTVYAGAGLLAMVPLILNGIGEGTCSWNR